MQIYCGFIHQESSKQTICKVGVTDLAFWHSFWQFGHAVIAYFRELGQMVNVYFEGSSSVSCSACVVLGNQYVQTGILVRNLMWSCHHP